MYIKCPGQQWHRGGTKTQSWLQLQYSVLSLSNTHRHSMQTHTDTQKEEKHRWWFSIVWLMLLNSDCTTGLKSLVLKQHLRWVSSILVWRFALAITLFRLCAGKAVMRIRSLSEKETHRIIEKKKLVLSSVQSLSHVRLFATPWTAAHQASLSITSS